MLGYTGVPELTWKGVNSAIHSPWMDLKQAWNWVCVAEGGATAGFQLNGLVAAQAMRDGECRF